MAIRPFAIQLSWLVSCIDKILTSTHSEITVSLVYSGNNCHQQPPIIII